MIKKTILLKLFPLAFGLLLCGTVSAQNSWEKPADKWNLDDCMKIINKSPWSFNYSEVGVEMDSKALNEKMTFGSVSPVIIVRLYSADIVRRALVRINQIGQKYDSLGASEKAKIDERNKPILDCELCKKYYIMVVLQPASSNASATLIGRRFRNVKFEDIKESIYLTNDKKEKRELVQYVAPQTDTGVAIFYFDRLGKDGKPLVTDDTKKLKPIFNINSISKFFLGGNVEFDVSKMKIDQKVDF
ncbi:MAG: hypothetical protein IPL32_14110 [Chloracidobacterium sp.]|nr:hypothetical protein [Chloracidobacterium sp.]